MNSNDLKAFIAVAEELNFRKAAERLSITQPPLSRQIAQLESNLGVPLFIRNTRKVEITAAGVVLLKEAREILKRMAEAELMVRRVSKLRRGTLTIRFTTMAYYSLLPNLVLQYREHFPDLDVDFRMKPFDKTWNDLETGRCDIVFCEGPLKDKNRPAHKVSSRELGVYIPIRHPLSKKKQIQISDLERPTFIFHPRADAPYFYDSIKTFLKDHSLDYSVRVRKDGESCRHLVAMGQGFLLAMRSSADNLDSNIRFVPLEKPAPDVDLFALWTNEERPEVKSFVSFLKEFKALDEPCAHCFMGLGDGS